MKRMLVGLAAVCLGLAGAAWTEDATQDEGWVSLFNGKDLTGWESKGGKATYKVEDGMIVGSSAPKTDNSFLCTTKQFSDFILEFEFKANPSMNSGVQIRSNSLPTYKLGRVHGYQCELEDENQDRDWSGGIYDEGRRGWLYPTKENEALAKQFSEQGKKVWKNGEWNQIRIEAKGNHIQTWVNGEPRADLEDDMTPTGFIALQVHGVGDRQEPLSVYWRNIRIKEQH